MKSHEDILKTKKSERMIIFEMIDASFELSRKKGPHPLEKGCNCIACVNKRKRLLEKPARNWKYRI